MNKWACLERADGFRAVGSDSKIQRRPSFIGKASRHDEKENPFCLPQSPPFLFPYFFERREKTEENNKKGKKKGRKRFVISLPLSRSRPSHRWFLSYAMKSAILAKMRPSRCETCTQNPQNRWGARETGGTTLKNEEKLDRTGFRMKESNEI